MLNLLAVVLVAAGLAILLAALPAMRKLIGELPEGPMRSQWRLLAGLILFFVVSYAAYLTLFWGRHQAIADLIVPVVFVTAGVFAWLASRLSLATVISGRRISTLNGAIGTAPVSGLDSRHYLDRRMREEMMRAERHG